MLKENQMLPYSQMYLFKEEEQKYRNDPKIERSEDKQEILDKWDKSSAVEENIYYHQESPIITHKNSNFSNKPLIVELFSGCGGTSLGFEMAGFGVAVCVDIHQPSISTIIKNHPNTSTILGDIKKVEPKQVLSLLNGQQTDVLIGGIPCQGFSLNNRKRTSNDKRNYLYKEFLRFVEILKPSVVVLENVSGMISSGDFVSNIETELSQIGGMRVRSELLCASDYGVPQKRKRLIFVGLKGQSFFDFKKIKKTHGIGADNPQNTVKDAISDLPRLNAGEEATTYLTDPQNDYQRELRLHTNILFNHTAPNHPLEVIEKIKNTPPGSPIYPKFKQRIRLSWDMQSPTQVAGGIRPQFQFGHPEDSRGLTVRERCRLQSFPDHYEIMGGITQGRVQTGNAVPPFLARAIALAIKEYLF